MEARVRAESKRLILMVVGGIVIIAAGFLVGIAGFVFYYRALAEFSNCLGSTICTWDRLWDLKGELDAASNFRIAWILGGVVVVILGIAVIRAGIREKEEFDKLTPVDQLANPVACGSCGLPIEKGKRRCDACGHAWCLNCGTWNEPGLERCVKCTFVLPSA